MNERDLLKKFLMWLDGDYHICDYGSADTISESNESLVDRFLIEANIPLVGRRKDDDMPDRAVGKSISQLSRGEKTS